jgi:hypothetical protein
VDVSDSIGYIITQEKPYTHRVHKEGLFWAEWAIQFEGQTVRTVSNMSATDIEQLVSLLNCAYQCGFSSGAVWGQNQAA